MQVMLGLDLNYREKLEKDDIQGVHPQIMIEGEWLMTTKEKICYFMTIQSLDAEKIETINEMRFGSFHKMGCPHLFEEVCLLMMNNIDPLNQTVVINERCYGVTTIDFEHVMGLRDEG